MFQNLYRFGQVVITLDLLYEFQMISCLQVRSQTASKSNVLQIVENACNKERLENFESLEIYGTGNAPAASFLNIPSFSKNMLPF